MHAFSDPAANVCTNDADFGFFSEGGRLAYFDFRSIDVNNAGTSTPTSVGNTVEFSLAPELKTVQIGKFGVRAAEMLVHPGASLHDDMTPGSTPNPVEDKDDLVFIAGGRAGLWVMEAHPAPLYDVNKAARIDNRGSLRSGRQNSERYCNGLSVGRIGDKSYLIALFSKGNGNRVRFYDLAKMPAVLANADADGYGGEILPDLQVMVNSHPGAPAEATFPGTAQHPVFAAPFTTDVEVHQCSPTAVDLYVAVGIHGLCRIQTRMSSGSLVAAQQWGPMFGTNCPGGYDDTVGTTSLNTDGYTARLYENLQWRRLDRNQDFDTVTRSDPPPFIDVAVHSSGEGCMVYAALDHLGWVRFDVTDPSDWADDIDIDHHEGVEVSLQDPASAPLNNVAWVTRDQTTVIQTTSWDPQLMRLFDLVDSFPIGLAPDDQPGAGSLNFCHEIDVTAVQVEGTNPPLFEPVVAAQFRGTPWYFEGRAARNGGFSYNNDQNTFGNIGSLAQIKTRIGVVGNVFPGRCAIHLVSAIDAAGGGGITWDGWIPDGGTDTHFPATHLAADTGRAGVLRFVHGRTDLSARAKGGLSGGMMSGSVPYRLGGCLSFFELRDYNPQGTLGRGLVRNAPVHVRNTINREGRHQFYAGPSLIDDRLLITSSSDAPFGNNDGMLYSPYDAPSDSWSLDALDGTQDERGTAGLTTERQSQWEDGNTLWTWGAKGVAFNIGTPSAPIPVRTNHFEVKEHLYTMGTPPLIRLERRRSLQTPMDRFEHPEYQRRPEHLGGSTLAEYDMHVSTLAGEPASFVFTSSSFSADGVQMFRRDLAVTEMLMNTQQDADEAFFDPRVNLGATNLWSAVTFDTHPELSCLPSIKYHDANDVDVMDNQLWENAATWWKAPVGSAQDIVPLQNAPAEVRTYPPRLLKLRSAESVSAPDRWVALVPCGHTVVSETFLSESGSSAPPGVTPTFTIPLDPSFAPDTFWTDRFDRGMLQIFDIHDPFAIAANSVVNLTLPPNPPSGYPTTAVRSYRSTVDPLISDLEGTAAYRVETAEFKVNGENRTFAFAVMFDGVVEVFDITDALYRASTGDIRPIFTWTAPLSVFDNIKNNIRALVIDPIGPRTAIAYVGVGRMGIMSVPFHAVTGFRDTERHLVPTPGEVFGLELRGEPGSATRTLICADSYAGHRVYSLKQVFQQAQGGTKPQ